MASREGAIAAMDESMEALAKESRAENQNSRGSANLALAVLRLAEARAWLISAGQSHGGSATNS